MLGTLLKFIALCVLFVCGGTRSDNAIKLFPYGLSHIDSTLPRDVDDISTSEIRLQTPVVMYGQQYSSAFVNQNGLISFLTDIPTFVNIQFPLDYPNIAPFYSDVDTRISGTVYYRETQADELLERARTLFSDHFSSAVNFQPTSLFITTWENVGYFDRKSDKVFNHKLPPDRLELPDRSNTYQVVIGSDSSDSYVAFFYDKIEWIQGTGKNPSLPDAKAQAGFNSGRGPHYELKGSGTDQISTIHKRSNVNEEGVWIFRIGRVGDALEEPDLNTDLASAGYSSSSCVAGGSTSCHSQARCVDYKPGFCCHCARGYFGNGRVCLEEESPIRMNGKVKGVFNGVGIEDSDLFSYIVPKDGRAYTAVAKVPERLGYDLQTVVILGTSIGWLFSTMIKGAPNGFQLTGGSLNYSSEISFQQTGHKVQVSQHFLGLDVFSHLRVDSRIHGSAPIIPIGKTIEINDFKMEYTRVRPGLMRSRSSHTYVVEGTSQQHPFTIEQTVEYEECPYASPLPEELNTLSTRIGRHYIVYDPQQEIVRYAITSKVSPVDGTDPCKENKDRCGPNSSCVVEGDDFRCICNLGYEERYRYDESGASGSEIPDCLDVDECAIGTSTCDVTAICYNSPGSFSCRCQPGYLGDGYTCTRQISCADVQCGVNAECVELSPGNPECRCSVGFVGDGLFCYEPSGVEVPPGGQPDCRQVRDLCDPFAECVYSSSSLSFVCSCLAGYAGDGLSCHRDAPVDEESCDIINNCHPYADCRLDEARNEYACVCKSGYVGDGYTCMRSPSYGPYPPDGRVPDPICVLGSCYCTSGYEYDEERGECKYVPSESSTEDVNCSQDPTVCDPNASCLYRNGKYHCVCNHGYGGNGRHCTPQDHCTSHSECSPYGECVHDQTEQRYSCRCREGFVGDGRDCKPQGDLGCDTLSNCDANAHCTWSSNLNKYTCECNHGYRGNGLVCKEDVLGCQQLHNCGKNAECLYEAGVRGYRCQCKSGYTGDGYQCKSAVPCYQDRSVCDINADCLPDSSTNEWKCQCKQGYFGDGEQCKEIASNQDGEALVVAKGMSLIKILLHDNRSLPLTVEPFQTAIGIDLDCYNQKLYWSDVATRSIKMGNVNGTGKGTLLEDGIGSPEGLSVDWASGNVYWTDSLKDTIEVYSLKNGLRKTVISTGLVNPRGIAVYPQRGRLFWSDWNREHPKIESSGLDGQDRETLVGDGLALPNSLVVDPEGDQLCWSDAGTKKIECVGIDGRNRRTQVTEVKYPFGLTMGPEHFYWTDWEMKRVESAFRRNGVISSHFDVSLGGPGKLYGIVYIPRQCPQVYSPCEYNPCGSDRICLPNARGSRSCVCGDNAPDYDCRDGF